WPEGQTMLQEPQFSESLKVSAQYVPQSAKPDEQVAAQPPDEQRCPAGHLVPQTPQLSLSAVTSMQAPEQAIDPVGQLNVQVPLWHCSPAAQAWPQLPQLAGSTVVAVQAPPQVVNGEGQLAWLSGQPARRSIINKDRRTGRPSCALRIPTECQPQYFL